MMVNVMEKVIMVSVMNNCGREGKHDKDGDRDNRILSVIMMRKWEWDDERDDDGEHKMTVSGIRSKT